MTPTKTAMQRVRNPKGRVDVLLSRMIETAAARNETWNAIFVQVRPHLDTLLKNELGPRTRRGRKISSYLFDLKRALEQAQKGRAA